MRAMSHSANLVLAAWRQLMKAPPARRMRRMRAHVTARGFASQFSSAPAVRSAMPTPTAAQALAALIMDASSNAPNSRARVRLIARIASARFPPISSPPALSASTQEPRSASARPCPTVLRARSAQCLPMVRRHSEIFAFNRASTSVKVLQSTETMKTAGSMLPAVAVQVADWKLEPGI